MPLKMPRSVSGEVCSQMYRGDPPRFLRLSSSVNRRKDFFGKVTSLNSSATPVVKNITKLPAKRSSVKSVVENGNKLFANASSAKSVVENTTKLFAKTTSAK